jgi:DNA (cytosine-5)-methyltransferase 1
VPKKKSYLTVTDQFCGAGGSSLGAAASGMEVMLAMNHWQLAIETHNTNFPDTLHDCADVSATDPRRYSSTDILVTSPECTNHSVAKGAKRRSKQMSLFGEAKIDPSAERSRATMWDVPRFAEYHNYNIIVVENVVDARHWIMWDAWIHAMNSLGYDYQIVYFNSQFAHLDPGHVANLHDFAPQSRDRMYVVFHKKGNKAPDLDFRPRAHCPSCDRIIEARQAFKPTPKVRELGGRWGRYGDQYVYICESCSLKGKDVVEVTPFYFAAANAIDWSLPAERIGDRERPLKEKTLDRIRKGLEMFGNQYLMVELRNGQDIRQLAETMSTITTSGAHHGVLMPWLLNTLHGDGLTAVVEALATQTARQSHALVLPSAFLTLNYSPGYSKSVGDSLAAVTAQDHHALVVPDAFLTSVNDFDPRNIPMDGAMGTQTTQTKWALTIPPHMVELRGTNRPKGMDEPLDTIAASGNHHGLVMGAPFLMSYYGSNGNQRTLDEAMGTLTATERHALVQVPFLLGYANGDGPAKTAVDPLRTIHTENGQALAQPHGIEVDDCYFRMLQPHEIGRGMAFPETYTVLGNKREQVRQLGNAVTPPVMKQILQRCAATLN